MIGALRVMVITTDQENANLIANHLGQHRKIEADGVAETHLANEIEHFSKHRYHALVVSGSLSGEWLSSKEKLTDGENIPVFYVMEPQNTDDLRTALEATLNELSEKLALTMALQQQHGDMRRIIEKCADSILICDEEGTILFLNPAATEFFAGALDVGDSFGYPICGEEMTEIDLICRDGDRRVSEMTVVPIEWNGTQACLATLRDVTARKISEEVLEDKIKERTIELRRTNEQLRQMCEVAERAIEARSQFIANVSHEIRTPLNGIISGADILLYTNDPKYTADMAGVIFDSAKRLLELVNNILDFSRNEKGTAKLVEQVFRLSVLVSDLIQQMQPLADKKTLKLKVEMSEDLPDVVWGDDGKLRQVLTNLVHNAIKFTSTGSIDLYVGRAPNGDILFRLRDTGIGISEADAELIFQPFMQANSSIQKDYGGSGLGLAICKQLAKTMNGELTFKSVAGEGSTFELVVPLKPVPDTDETNGNHNDEPDDQQ